jgi:2-polyprenyl-3-methyl-5-hydroxy-6-metoxy-1,4-benzoquinol methylase
MTALDSQAERYADFYSGWRHLSRLVRFDVRYRCRRMHEVLRDLDIDVSNSQVMDVGFGWGDMLASFPEGCAVTGADLSSSAVHRAREDPRWQRFANARFVTVREDEVDDVPAGPFDVIVSSHVLEHVPDDEALIAALKQRLAPGGLLLVFVPIEPPDYNLIHARSYSLQSITERLVLSGLDVLHAESNMFVEGHIWKWLSIPTRRRWPVVGRLMSAVRMGSLSLLPYGTLRAADEGLFRVGAGARQAFLVARRPDER